MVFKSTGSRLPSIPKMMPWMKSKVLNHEIGLCQETKAGRIGGNGSGSAAESPCVENANIGMMNIFAVTFLSRECLARLGKSGCVAALAMLTRPHPSKARRTEERWCGRVGRLRIASAQAIVNHRRYRRKIIFGESR